MAGPEQPSQIIYGVHPVLEALRQGGLPLEEIALAPGRHGPWAEEVRTLARQQQVRFRVVERARLDQMARTTNHQGIVARMGSFPYAAPDDVLDRLIEAGPQALAVVADGLQDPMNLGNLIRSAHAAGAQGLFIPKDRAVGLTPAVAKAAAGALAYLPVARVTNLADLLARLKEIGLWVMGTAAEAADSLFTADLSGPLALVIGSEGKGLRPRVRQSCDLLLAIPLADTTLGSLNAATAGAVCLFEVRRQRSLEPGPVLREG